MLWKSPLVKPVSVCALSKTEENGRFHQIWLANMTLLPVCIVKFEQGKFGGNFRQIAEKTSFASLLFTWDDTDLEFLIIQLLVHIIQG